MIACVLHCRDVDLKFVLIGIILDSMAIPPTDKKNKLCSQ